MEKKQKVKAIVVSQREIASNIFDMWIQTDLYQQAKAGQFLSVYPKNESTLLPRPISICEVDEANRSLRIVYRIEGKGTREFSTYQPGETISILGCLGNGFPIEKINHDTSIKKAFLIGGGIGIPPMLELAKQLKCDKSIILGYRNEELFLKDELEANGTVYIATQDGSVGTSGTVIDAIMENSLEADIIFACGPMPMLSAIKQYACQHDLEAYISLEERMACGVGACLGCVQKTKTIDHHSHVDNARVCTEGPVFEAQEVII